TRSSATPPGRPSQGPAWSGPGRRSTCSMSFAGCANGSGQMLRPRPSARSSVAWRGGGFSLGFPGRGLAPTRGGWRLPRSSGGGDPPVFARPAQLRRSFRLTSAAATWWLGGDVGARAALLALADEAVARNDDLSAVLAYYELARLSLDRPIDAARYAEQGFDL